ncbi:Hypothetical predicted protein [Paramuricea clavata]|uniref:Uncharacterized protein n=1 Tax=Paramuricea clavata TaxID=317549 RepID=A0A6S7GNX4_PARCT|nr:Hypothetical predicted protein [Paramuricea clavata]
MMCVYTGWSRNLSSYTTDTESDEEETEADDAQEDEEVEEDEEETTDIADDEPEKRGQCFPTDGYADDTGKANFGVRHVDVDVYANPNFALELSANDSYVSGEYAVLWSDSKSSDTNTATLITKDMEVSTCGRPKRFHTKFVSAKMSHVSAPNVTADVIIAVVFAGMCANTERLAISK